MLPPAPTPFLLFNSKIAIFYGQVIFHHRNSCEIPEGIFRASQITEVLYGEPKSHCNDTWAIVPRPRIALVVAQNFLFSLLATRIPTRRCNNYKFPLATIVAHLLTCEVRATRTHSGVIATCSARTSSSIPNFLSSWSQFWCGTTGASAWVSPVQCCGSVLAFCRLPPWDACRASRLNGPSVHNCLSVKAQ